ncbi:MAG: hypothetical protein ACLP3C_15605 [Mycobacterium sp.]|uniref:hypothetical protein n=1 Tax=Mycobacterium sp. TaxID=1785 RepID=UPI003F94BA76
MTTIEYAAMTDAELRRLDTDTNGCDGYGAELRRRGIAELTGAAGRTPADRLRELERLGPYGPMSTEERSLRTAAMYRGNDPKSALLATWPYRLLGEW